MKRTKPKAGNVLPRNLKNAGTQTESFNSLVKIANLEEQVKTLQIENNVLRRYMETNNKPNDTVRPRFAPFTPQSSSKVNIEKSGCGCKGNCSLRICGCVKKNNKCSPLCRCDQTVCQNQKSENNQENKENEIDVTPRKRNENTKRTKDNNLFSPDIKDYKENQYSGIYFSFNGKDISTLTNSQNINNVGFRKKGEKEKKEIAKEQEKVVFKPRHQLSRTPPKNLEISLEGRQLSQTPENLEIPFEKSSPQLSSKNKNSLGTPISQSLRTPQPEVKNRIQLHSEFTGGEATNISPYKFEDIKEEQVDWQEHTAQLIRCKKCKRTFLPDRIQKHEACCKKI